MADDPKSHAEVNKEDAAAQGFVRQLGLLDSTMLVAGSMIGSGIFIVSADIGRLVGRPDGCLWCGR
jgi:amino acid transporter